MTERSMGPESYAGRASANPAAAAGRMSEQLSQTADKAKSKLDSAREPIADKLHGAADTIREQAGRLPGGEAIEGAAQSAADKLESSASYLESHNAREIMQDLMVVVKRHPTQALLIAGALGFLLARAMRGD